MIAPPVSGNQQRFDPLPLLDPQETAIQPTPAPLPSPDLSPLPSLDLLENPSLECGSRFRHSGWASHRRRVGKAIAQVTEDPGRLERFTGCGAGAWVVVHPDDPRDFRVMSHLCHDRFCQPCAALRGRTIATNLLNAIGDRPVRLVTLTLQSVHGDPLKPLLDKLYRCFALLRRRPWWQRLVTGGAALLEVKYAARTRRWHPHLHILCHGKFIPQPELSAIWDQITRGSMIVDVRFVRDHGQIANYVTKYVAKPGDYTVIHSVELLAELIAAVHGRRLCGTFGTWTGVSLLARGEPVDWIFVDTLGALHSRASEGDETSQRILRMIALIPDRDEPDEHDLPTLYD